MTGKLRVSEILDALLAALENRDCEHDNDLADFWAAELRSHAAMLEEIAHGDDSPEKA